MENLFDDVETGKTKFPKKKVRLPLESAEQRNFIFWMQINHPDIIVVMIDNEGTRNRRSLGLHKGASDLFIPQLKCFIEMKRLKGGKASKEQLDFIEDMRSLGYVAEICKGSIEAQNLVSKLLS